MKLEHLRTLLAVIEHGSFTDAARARGTSQSTASAQIASLEADIGVQLLDRRGGAAPTPAGRVLQGYAVRLLDLADEAAAATRSERQVVSGAVTLAASTIPGTYLLPAVLARFRAAHPEVTVRVRTSDSQAAASALIERRCDLAVIGSPPSDPRIVAHRLAEDEVVLVGPPGSPASLPHLDGQPVVFREAGSGTRAAVAHLLPREAVVEVGSTEAARHCVREGIGYTFVSRMAVADDLARGLLQEVALPGGHVRRALCVARMRDVTLTAAARALWGVLTTSDFPMTATG